jgi:hypothetical protein
MLSVIFSYYLRRRIIHSLEKKRLRREEKEEQP